MVDLICLNYILFVKDLANQIMCPQSHLFLRGTSSSGNENAPSLAAQEDLSDIL